MVKFLNLICPNPEIAVFNHALIAQSGALLSQGLKWCRVGDVKLYFFKKWSWGGFIFKQKPIRSLERQVSSDGFWWKRTSRHPYERRLKFCGKMLSNVVDVVEFQSAGISFSINIFRLLLGWNEHKKNALDFFRAPNGLRKIFPV